MTKDVKPDNLYTLNYLPLKKSPTKIKNSSESESLTIINVLSNF